MRQALVITLTLVALSDGAARAGVVMVTRGRSTGYGPGAGLTTVSFDHNRLRIENENPVGKLVVLFHGDTKTASFLDPQQRAYSERTEEDAKRDKAQIDAQLANPEPSQRKFTAERAATPRGPVKFDEVGTTRTVNGFVCRDYRLKREGKLIGEACIVPWAAAGVAREDFVVLGQFVAAMRGGRMEQDDMLDASTFPGVAALYKVVKADGTTGREEELVSIKKQSVPEDQFRVPADFTLRGRDPNARMPQIGSPPKVMPAQTVKIPGTQTTGGPH